MVILLIYLKEMYVSPDIKNIKEIKNKLNDEISIYNIYLICVFKNSTSLFEIIHSTEIFKTINYRKEFIIVGIAEGKKNSFLLMTDIVKDFCKLNKSINEIKDFYLKSSFKEM